jgi:hypothetical protein
MTILLHTGGRGAARASLTHAAILRQLQHALERG